MKAFKAAIRALALAGLGFASMAAARAEDIVVTHYGSLLYGVPYAIAMEKGYFKEAGVDVTGILTSKGGGTSVRNMMAGDTLFAEVALPAALSAIKEGFNIKIISGGTDGRSSYWVTRVGEKIDKPEDLKGKRFVYSRPKSVSESITLAVLKSWDVPVADVKMVAIGDFGAGLTALEHNKVDVAIIPEPIYSQKEKAGVKYKILPWLDEKLPAYTQTVGIATDEAHRQARAQAQGRHRGAPQGRRVPLRQPQGSRPRSWPRHYNLPPDVAASAIANILKMNPTWWNHGELKQPLMEAMAEALGSVGALQLPIDWKAATNDELRRRRKTQ